MCGIDGFLNSVAFDEETARGTLARMTASLAHRGPDGQGIWVDPEAGIALGHRRLAIVDLSVHGRQPMASACGRYVLVFNGEIYNHRELRAELERAGRAPAWRGHSDSEVLIAAIVAWGVEATLRRATGMFAFALWNRASRVLTLARDRIGEKPLYYGRIGDALVFASELKALRGYPGFDGTVDRDALCLYLRQSSVPAPYTIYRGIRKLPPGTYIQFEHARDTPRLRAYWTLEQAIEAGRAQPFDGTSDEAVGQLDAILRQAVARQMEADVPLGAFLSGGVDSSAIVALMQAQSATPVDTFTIGFHEAGYDEAGYAKAVARHLGTRHTELYVTADHALGVVPKLPSIYDEPFSDASQIPTFLVSELTRRHVKVSLSGDGGDELFGGYTRYFLTPRLWRKLHRVPGAVRARIAAALHALRPDHADQLAAVAQGAWGGGVEARESTSRIGDRLHKLGHVMTAESRIGLYRLLMSSVHHPERIALSGQEPPTPLDTVSAWPAHLSFAEQAMAIDTLTYLPTDILAKVDRAAMAVSLETRMPFLDHHVVEFAWRVPASVRLPEGQSKALLRRLLDRYVPSALIDRPKQGFCAPVDHWLRGALRDWAEALLRPSRLREEGFFDAAAVERLWRQHQTGRMNWQHQLWTVLMFQAWLEAQRAA
ncbi:TPA: asparagine synthase (glutamine-hydrolyzing) [Burkholderia cenocepacia]|uniref:asparagine synthase (glutamine-hydrolyzing) n=1 Tax=Burkholderia TaxID=32008 RepID=UPI000DAE1E87|nr:MULTISPECIES: asparagine synthase (glutamine-hydrolyzing) [Burkholderia]MBJ9895123.1 asparagine synthase (glutamine-hydrolyzing) [Burkholderia cenocepacia]MBR8121417.1 asparagine synthase (glutamine-hydrolyzing) [Burkholderia cenocepacia]MBR8266656.1 asparagine synthase (glutamine-hydrolyzing) [Burkholderia cenocepacia]MBR8373090.1 asparagine synthase (glutamine-hydrolyzing) [Burkholderia cenocepacia]MBR8384958.1 asparagine synthase (glutamine-hydrolyzing) [Burkholderia cenocepacia]